MNNVDCNILNVDCNISPDEIYVNTTNINPHINHRPHITVLFLQYTIYKYF